ncbi:MAG: NAD-dependent epimerase/dehydratase family protein, partial [Deltaproteobacteria bacterium]
DLQWAAERPSSCLRLHAGAVLGLLDACHRQSVAQVVLLSSYHVYGGSRRYPFAVDDPANVQLSHLGAAFRAMELHAAVFAQTSPVGVTVARMFSLYGPGQGPDRFVPALCEAAEHRRPLPIVGDGTASRDFVFVDDAVEFLVKVMENPSPWRILNLAGGSSTTLAQVAEQVSWLADVVRRTRSLPLRPGEMPQAWADMKDAERLGFVPRTQLAEGLRRYWQWHQNRPACFRPRPERRS